MPAGRRPAAVKPTIIGMSGTHAGIGRQASRDARWFFVALAISIAVHAALVMWLKDSPMGHIDPRLLSAEREVYSVARVDQQDRIIDDSPEDEPDVDSSPQQKKPDLADLSASLLMEQEAPAGDPEPQKAPKVALRDMSESRLRDMIDQLARSVPAVELPESMQNQLEPQLSVEVRHQPTTGGSGGGGGLGGDAELNEAQRMLAESRLLAGPAPILNQTGPPQVRESRREVADQRELEKPTVNPAIDFVQMALGGTTQLAVPEHLDDDFEYVLTKYLPTETVGGFLGMGGEQRRADEPGYFRVEIRPKRSLRKLTTMPKDVVFIIDISGSIPQLWVNQIISGVGDALSALNPGDRFNIVFFTETPVIFSPGDIAEFNADTLRRAQSFLQNRQSGGYTDVNRALSRLLVRDVAVDRVYDLVLISDGRPTKGVMDTRELINLITRDNDLASSIYCVGVSNVQNRELLEFLAYRNKGYCLFAETEGEAANSIRQLMSRIRYPIMKDVRLSVQGVDSNQLFPRDLPNIHQNETFAIYGRFGRPDTFTMRLIGHNAEKLLDFTFKRDLAQAPMGSQEIATGWAFWKLHDLYNEMIRQGETKQLLDAIDYLRRKYKLKTLY